MKKIRLILISIVLSNSVYSQLWSKLNFNLDFGIRSLYSDSVTNKMYMGGYFKKVNDTLTAKNILAYNGSTFETLGGGLDSAFSNSFIRVDAIASYKNKLYVGGYFKQAGSKTVKNIATWSNNKWDSIPNGRFDDIPVCFKVINDKLYIGGVFTKIGNLNVAYIAYYDGIDFHTLPSFQSYHVLSISNIEYYNGSIYVSGSIADSTGWPVGVLKLTNNGWQQLGSGIQGADVAIYKLKTYKNKLYVTGYYHAANNNVDDFIQSWNDTIWQSVGGGTGDFNGAIFDMSVHENKLYCTGVLESAGGVTASKFTTWDGENWCSVGSVFDNVLLANTFYKDTLYVAGSFWSIDGDSSIAYIAKWTGGDYVSECGNTTNTNNIENIFKLFTIYPNPAANILSIQLNASFNNSHCIIYNSIGQAILTEQLKTDNKTIDISLLPKGIYTLQITNNNTQQHTIFMKQY